MALESTLRALGDATRREIVKVLRDKGDLAAGDLSVLKDAGLVTAERQGRQIIYSLNTTVFHEAVEQVLRILDTGGQR